MILGLGAPELIVILIIVLVIFGPKNLPKLGKSLGKTVKGIREGMDEAQDGAKGEDAEAKDVVVEHNDDTDIEDAPIADPDSDADASTSGEKFCGKCGTANSPENHFCKKCGAKLD